MKMIDNNFAVILNELKWIKSIIQKRVYAESQKSSDDHTAPVDVYKILPPDFGAAETGYSDFVKKNDLSFNERALLILALMPHINPVLLTDYSNPATQFATRFEPVPGVTGNNYKGLLPTGLTFLYIMAGNDVQQRLILHDFLSSSNVLAEQQVIILEPHFRGDPCFSGRIIMSEKFIELFTIGETDKKKSLKYSFTN